MMIMCVDLGRNFTNFFGGVRGYFLFSKSSSPWVLYPVNCPTEVHSTTIFAPRNGKNFQHGG